jgi:hypothetical protein
MDSRFLSGKTQGLQLVDIPAASTAQGKNRKEPVCARKQFLHAVENTAAAFFLFEHSEIPQRAPRRRSHSSR